MIPGKLTKFVDLQSSYKPDLYNYTNSQLTTQIRYVISVYDVFVILNACSHAFITKKAQLTLQSTKIIHLKWEHPNRFILV